MKKLVILIAALALTAGSLSAQITNRYSMKLKEVGEGQYELLTPKKYKYINLNEVPDLLVPYEPQNFVSSKLYKSCESVDYVYKTYPDYELVLTIDKAVSEEPAPFMVYLHGGGWARGTRDSNKSLSQYLAVQKGIAGVRISYTLAGQSGASIGVSVQDVEDAVKWVQEHAEELGVNPKVFGFCGGSAGGHLAAYGAMTIKGAKVLVGYAGIYDLTTAALIVRSKDAQRIGYFEDRAPSVLKKYSPEYVVPKKNIPASLLVCGTGDSVVEYTQSENFAATLKKKGGYVDLVIYPYYDHNLNSKKSDKAGEIFYKTVDFVVEHLK